MVIGLAPDLLHDRDVVVLAQVVERRQEGLGMAPEVGRQHGEELLVLALAGDQMALVRQPGGQGRAQAGLIVSLERAPEGAGVGLRRAAPAA